MNTKGLLEQLLGSGSSNNSASKGQGRGFFDSFGGGAVTGGALGLLLGSKKGRKLGGKVLTYGGLAALGVFAYKAYNNYQQKQSNTTSNPNSNPQGFSAQTIDRVPAAQVETHSVAILTAIIGAAKADGHIDERERQLIDQEIGQLQTDADTQQWLQAELAKPLDPSDVARQASSPEIAAEMYLASVFAVDTQNFMERSYLQELARQLRLEPGLQAELDQQAQQALQQS